MKHGHAAHFGEKIKNITTKDLQVFEWLNKGVPVLIGIFIFFNTFPHITAIKEICYYLSVFIVIILYLFKKNDISFETPFLIPVGLFFIWTFLGLFFAIDKNNSIHDFYAHFIRYILIYYILINYFKSKETFIALSWIVIISCSIFSIGSIYYYHFILGKALTQRFTGFTQVPVSVIATITATAAIFCINNFINEIKLFRKLILFICFCLVLFLIVLSQTVATFVGLCFAIVILFFNNKKILMAVLSAILIIFIMSPFKDRIASYVSRPLIALRIGADYNNFEVIKDYPIMGIGFGMETFKNAIDLKKYHERVPKKYREDFIYNDPHNMFFDIAVRLGVVGIIIFFYIIFSYFKICLGHCKVWERRFCKKLGPLPCRCFFYFFIYRFFSSGFQP